jgi:hypothetical protein
MSTLDRFARLTIEDKERIRQEIVDSCDLVADCWVYRGTNSAGYGVKRIAGKIITVSRFMLAYSTRESLNYADAACHVRECPYRACCNPKHLFWGSHTENAEQREGDAREVRHRAAIAPPVPLGHETHEQHAAWLACRQQPSTFPVDSSLQQGIADFRQSAHT